MFKISLKLINGELSIKFYDMQDLENQLRNIDLEKINQLLGSKLGLDSSITQPKSNKIFESEKLNELGIINLLKVSQKGNDATKLAIFLASNGLNREEIKKITGIRLLSD